LPGKTFYSAVIKRWQFTSQVTNDLDVIIDIYNEAIKTITATLAIQSKSADEYELGVSKNW
jgi:L-amino acid N-acyltransferase YncA